MKGTVQAVSTKYGKFSVMVDDVWYGTKEEWAPNPRPSKGDVIEFDNKGAKWLNKCRIVSSGGAASAAPKSGRPYTANNIGVELGHAANLAQRVMEVMYCEDQLDASDVEVGSAQYYTIFAEQTLRAYKVMKSLRAKVEKGDDAVTDEPAPPATPEPTPEAVEEPEDFEDLF